MGRRDGKSKTRIFLVDDHPIVLRGFEFLIAMEPDLMVCGEAGTGPAALEKILKLKPDLVIVDLMLKAGSGLDVIKQLHVLCPNLKILVFTMRSESVYAERALHAGASGFVAKEEGTEKAIGAVRLLMQGKHYLSEGLAAVMLDRMVRNSSQPKAPCESLSGRELEVLEMIGRGLGSREIAQTLCLSTKTIDSHREHIKQKLGLKSASELVNYAFTWTK